MTAHVSVKSVPQTRNRRQHDNAHKGATERNHKRLRGNTRSSAASSLKTILAFALLFVLTGKVRTTYAANFILEYEDTPGEGFNDSTDAAPVGGNTGTSLGAQRTIAVQHALDIWGALLDSPVDIRVQATFTRDARLTPCGPTGGVLAAAGAEVQLRSENEGGLPLLNVWYPQPLANALFEVDTAPERSDLIVAINGSLGTESCFRGLEWYYGLDSSPGPRQLDLVMVILHEVAHGLGFANGVNAETGALSNGIIDVFSHNLLDASTNKAWKDMSDQERQASAENTGNLVWTGAKANEAARAFLTSGLGPGQRLRMYAPSPARQGSSVGHFSPVANPPLLMFPEATVTKPDVDITIALLKDLGWPTFETCGNGVLDEGEECDPGVEESKDRVHCCDESCRVRGPGYICREADPDNACDVPSTCDGESSTCRSGDLSDTNGMSCLPLSAGCEVAGLCMQGQCTPQSDCPTDGSGGGGGNGGSGAGNGGSAQMPDDPGSLSSGSGGDASGPQGGQNDSEPNRDSPTGDTSGTTSPRGTRPASAPSGGCRVATDTQAAGSGIRHIPWLLAVGFVFYRSRRNRYKGRGGVQSEQESPLRERARLARIMRGYFSIGVEGISKPGNWGSLLRSAHAFGASYFFAVSPRFDVESTRGSDTSMGQGLPVFTYEKAEALQTPHGCKLIGIEFTEDAVELPSFFHPPAAAYVLGPEKSNLSPAMQERCDALIKIPTKFCVNVGIAGAIVMYDRLLVHGRFAPRPVSSLGPMVPRPKHVHGPQLIKKDGKAVPIP